MRLAIFAALLSIGTAMPVIAADPGQLDLRVGKLEKEMRAVQRKVFPAGAPVEPEITPAQPTATPSGSTTPLSDLTQRVDLLEAQVKTLTGQAEQADIRAKRLEEALAAHERRLKLLETPPPPLATETPAPSAAISTPPKTGKAARPTVPPKVAPAPTDASATGKKRAAKPMSYKRRQAMVDAVKIPDGPDDMENSYTYAVRLFEAKLYPETRAKLDEFMSKYAKSRRASYAQNLLGRAYFEDGDYKYAARVFVENYQTRPRGERAPESLSWAGLAFIKDGAPAKACRIYEEFDAVYGQKAPRDVLTRVKQGRTDAKCTG